MRVRVPPLAHPVLKTRYFVLHAQGDYAHGRWVGLSYDGPVISGYATLARTQDEAKAVMQRLLDMMDPPL